MSDDSETGPDEARAARGAGLERREELKGRRPGDRVVKIVRPKEFRRTTGGFIATDEALAPQTRASRAWGDVRRRLIGRRLASDEELTERLTKKTGLAIMASDNISSSAYATEEAMRVLALAGASYLALTMPVTIAIVVVLAVVVLSYLQVIRAYPNGGGSYVVASENLGVVPGLVAASALLVDYVLTVAVSVAAGVAAVTSAVPELYPERVLIGVVLVAVLTVGNLRGVREAGVIFAAPTYVYIVAMYGLIAYGLYRMVTGDMPQPVAPPESFDPNGTQSFVLVFLILRAFASGSSGLTGTEAVANGVPAFKPPESRNASRVLLVMGTVFGSLFLLISYMATTIGIQPDRSETQTVLSLLARSIVGDGPYYVLVQLSTTVILTLAANTAFNGFPRLASIMAADRFMPRQFAQRGDRLAFSTGILALALLSSLLIVKYEASVTALIPLYTVGVFIAFTLSQAGMVRKWLRERSRGWLPSASINAFGAVATAVVAIVVSTAKFADGAWMVLAVLPLLVWMLYGIRIHYRAIEDRLLIAATAPVRVLPTQPRIIVPISRIDRAALRALSVARGLTGDLYAVHISFDAEGARAFKKRWSRVVGDAIALDTIISPYRALMPPLLRYIDAVDRGDPGRPIIIVLAEFVPRHWWEALLHNQTALLLKLRLFVRPNTSVLDVPYHLDDPDPLDLDGDGIPDPPVDRR